MYVPGSIIYFTPFYFPNGQSAPKPKYFIVLNISENNILIASLPTSIDHVPSSINKKHGCLNDNSINFNCYFFQHGTIITDNSFAFPLDTYVYGEQVDFFDKKLMESLYQNPKTDFQIIGTLKKPELAQLKECIKKSGSVKRKIKRNID